SRARFQSSADEGENLLTNGDFSLPNAASQAEDPYRWDNSYGYVHHSDSARVRPMQAKIRDFITWDIQDGVASIVKGPELLELCGDLTPSVSGAWSKFVRLPNSEGGNYRLVFDYQAQHQSSGNNVVLALFKGEAENPLKAKDLPGMLSLGFNDLVGDWGLFSQEIVAPAGTQYLSLIFRIDGVGSLRMRNVRLLPVEKREKLTLKLSPQGFLDSVFTLSQSQPAVMTFAWRRNGTAEEAKMTRPYHLLRFPKGIKFLRPAHNLSFTIEEDAEGTEVKIDLGHGYRNRPSVIHGFDFYLVLTALITTDLDPGSAIGPGSCWIEDQGEVVSNRQPFTFAVDPPIKAQAKGKKYLSGFYIGGRYYHFNSENNDFMAKFLNDVGVRWIICQPVGTQLPSWREAGIEVVTPELYYIANGFRIGPPEKRPEADKYKFLGDSPASDLKMASCPIAVYEKRAFFRETVMDYLRENLQGTDGIWSNWEPYMFAGKGCFCDDCRAAFAKYVDVPLEQMKKEWPLELGRGKKYYQQAVRFRSLEHAKVVRTMHEAACALTGGEKSFGFIPGVAWCEMASCWRDISNGKEVHQSDYAADLRWIDPWGPYPCWNTQKPYVYRKAINLATFVSARDVRAQVNQDYPPESRPKLLAFPHGIQCSAWVTQPEAMEMDLNSFFFNGYEAATLYIFPRGYDNRYWAAFARAANYVAEFEDYIFEGTRLDEQVTLTPQAPYCLPAGRVSSYLPKITDVPMLQHAAYRLDEKTIVAVFNFWEKGSAFFQLQLAGLPPENKYQIVSDGKLFAPGKTGFFSSANYYTGAQLADGVELFVGAVRCAVFSIVPAGEYRKVDFSLADIREFRQKLLPELTSAAREDELYEERYGHKASKLVSQENGGIVAKADSEAGLLQFSAGGNTLSLNCKTMSVTAWSVGGTPQLLGSESSGLGTVAFWSPSYQVNAPFVVTQQEQVEGGLQVTGEVKIHNQMSVDLEYLTVRQTFKVTEQCRRVEVRTELVNESSDENPRSLRAGLRYHCFPAAPAQKGGYIEYSSNGQKTRFSRKFSRSLFSSGDPEFEKVIRSVFEVKEDTLKIDYPEVKFVNPQGASEFTLSPADSFLGYALWDTPTQASSTFEACFREVTLRTKGDKASFGLIMQVK
ncbi:MAG: hypothetical protein WCR92_09000, partial [Candidatus Cloacimonadaceae bacterium]